MLQFDTCNLHTLELSVIFVTIRRYRHQNLRCAAIGLRRKTWSFHWNAPKCYYSSMHFSESVHFLPERNSSFLWLWAIWWHFGSGSEKGGCISLCSLVYLVILWFYPLPHLSPPFCLVAITVRPFCLYFSRE